MNVTIPQGIVDAFKSKEKIKKKVEPNGFSRLLKKAKRAVPRGSNENNLTGFITSIVGLFITLSVGMVILGQVQKTASVDSVGSITGMQYNASGPTGTMVNNMLGQMPSFIGILLVVGMATLVLGYFYRR